VNCMSNYPLYIQLPGIEVYFVEYLLNRPRSNVQAMHSHTTYELMCIHTEAGTVFRIIPPFYEHIGEDTSQANVLSLLFAFTQPPVNDICQVLQSIKDAPVDFPDDFQGYGWFQSIKQLVQDLSQPGAYEQLSAQLRLLFVCIARKQSSVSGSAPDFHQTLDNKRLAIMEDFFSVVGVRDRDCSKAKLANQLGVSERQLTRILDQTYHLKFPELVLRSRMRIAQAHILEGEKSLDFIADYVGFSSTDAFKRAYREYFGISLKTYKSPKSQKTR